MGNLVKKPSSEIKQLCLASIEGQIKELIAHEGEDSPLLILLRKELNEVRYFSFLKLLVFYVLNKQIKKIDTNKADHESRKYINAFDNV